MSTIASDPVLVLRDSYANIITSPLHNVGEVRGSRALHEEGCRGIPVPEHVQYLRSEVGVRTIVERQHDLKRRQRTEGIRERIWR